MTSNTPAGLSSKGTATDGPARDELVLADAEQRGLPRPVLLDHDTQDRPGHGYGREHRGQDADDQDEGEAADRRAADPVQDAGRDQTRHVRVQDRVPGAVEAGLDRPGERFADAQLFL